MNKGSNGVDDRLWKPEVDKAGNGYAVIRFLPAPDGEDFALGKTLYPCIPSIWWLVHRELINNTWSERPSIRA